MFTKIGLFHTSFVNEKGGWNVTLTLDSPSTLDSPYVFICLVIHWENIAWMHLLLPQSQDPHRVKKRLKQRVRTAGRLWWTSGLMVAMAMGMGGSQAASIAVANSWDNFEMERAIWGSYFLWDASIAWPCCLWAVLKGNTYGRVNWPLLGNQDAKGKDRKGLRFQYPLPCHTSKNMTCFV